MENPLADPESVLATLRTIHPCLRFPLVGVLSTDRLTTAASTADASAERPAARPTKRSACIDVGWVSPMTLVAPIPTSGVPKPPPIVPAIEPGTHRPAPPELSDHESTLSRTRQWAARNAAMPASPSGPSSAPKDRLLQPRASATVDLAALDVELPRGVRTRLNAPAHDAHAGIERLPW